jgi:hypothetical protein
MANSCLWIDRSLRGEAGNTQAIGVMISPESNTQCSLEAAAPMDLFMGAIQGFDSTPDEKSVRVTETRVFPRFAALCSAE